MAQNFITFEHPRTGITRTVPIGFNWRLLQFGVFLPLYQREWKLCLLVLGGGALTFSTSNILLAFFYNKLRVRSLIADGFLARGTEEGTLREAEVRLGLPLPRHLPSDEPISALPESQEIKHTLGHLSTQETRNNHPVEGRHNDYRCGPLDSAKSPSLPLATP